MGSLQQSINSREAFDVMTQHTAGVTNRERPVNSGDATLAAS